MKSLACFFGLFFLTSCGYHFGHGNCLLSNQTISIPYVEGDPDGTLTSAVIKTLTSSIDVNYQNCGGNLLLKIKVLDSREENIGFRYDRTRRARIKKYIIPVETRVSLLAQVTLINAQTLCPLLGPVLIMASVDYDHDYYSSRDGVNIFSLGQLIDIDSAEETVRKPLYEELASKIADFLINAG